MKTLHNTDTSGTEKNVPDVAKFGDPDAWVLLCKASSQSEGWMKSTKAMDAGAGCLVQVTTQQQNPDGSYTVAEALQYVPNVDITEGREANGEVAWRELSYRPEITQYS